MAKNRKPVKPVESGSEPEQKKITKKPSSSSSSAKKPQPPSASKPEHSSSSDEEIAGSDSDPKLRPIPAKPMDGPQKSNNGARKPKSKPAASDDPKKPLFQRVWSEDDGIAILKGMINYSAKKKADPASDLNAFLDFIKKDLHADVTRTQLQDKIRSLKRKYQTNIKKEKEGKERTKKPHEQKAYELSKIVWGKKEDEKAPIESVAKRPRGEDAMEAKSLVGVKDDSEKVLPAKRVKLVGASTEEKFLMTGDDLVGKGKGAEEWKKLNTEEIDAYLRHLDVKIKQAKLVMDNLKSGGY